MIHHRTVHSGNLVLVLFLCLLGRASTFAAKTDTLTPPAKELAAGAVRESDCHAVTETGSYVEHVTSQYSTEGSELTVKVPGGRLSVRLSYEQGGKSD